MNVATKLKWRCESGHAFEVCATKVKRGRWCPECRGEMILGEKLLTLWEIAEERGGECLSTNYTGAYRKLRWKCSGGHIWDSTPHSIGQGHWCPECGKKRGGGQRLTIREMQEIARERGGRCISAEYKNVMTKLKWQCSEGHIWEAIPNSIKTTGMWCPKCKHGNLTIQEMQELAKGRNGKCLSTEYANTRTKLKWKCSEGHTWMARPHDIKGGSWCPTCARIKRKTR